MLFQEFILRFIKLDGGVIFLRQIQQNKLVFRWSNDALSCLSDLKDLLNTLLEEQDGYYSVNMDMRGKCLEFEFHEGEC